LILDIEKQVLGIETLESIKREPFCKLLECLIDFIDTYLKYYDEKALIVLEGVVKDIGHDS
jgi:hypothetical protein